MKRLVAVIFAACITYNANAMMQSDTAGNSPGFSLTLNIPARSRDAHSGTDVIKRMESLPLIEREEVIYSEIANGNVPDFLRHYAVISDTASDAGGVLHEIELYVLPNFIAIGSDCDFIIMPMLPVTGQRIADLAGAILPTRKISDLIAKHSKVKLQPIPMTPDSTMTTIPVFVMHNKRILAAVDSVGQPLSSLTCGNKKDIVITNRLVENGRVFIYGWHYPDGKAIQPLSGVHGIMYVDYSHGVRLIKEIVRIDGKLRDIRDILKDPVLYAILSDEEGPMQVTDYPAFIPSE